MKAAMTVMAAGILAGCGAPSTPGFVWHIAVSADPAPVDLCNTPPKDYSGPKTFDFLLTFEGAKVSVSTDDTVFATGSISGCDITYDSVVWGEKDGDFDVKWQLHGDATFREGGASCSLPSGTDWDGTETYEIINTNNPAIAPGCTYTLTETGTYGGPS